MRGRLRIIFIASALTLWGCATTAPKAEESDTASKEEAAPGASLSQGGGGAAGGGIGAAKASRATRGGAMAKKDPVMSLAAPSATADVGSIDRQAIKARVREQIGGVKDCYKAALDREPGMAGKVQLEFEIGADGRVTSANAISNDLEDEDLMACIQEQVSGWSFPGAAGTTIKYPLVFKPE